MSEMERNKFITMLYNDYFDRLVLFCHRVTGYRPELMPFAEECVQDVFHTAIKKYTKLVNHPDIEGWFFRSCINRMNNVLKTYYGRKKRHAYSIDADNVKELFDPNDSFQCFEEEQAYREVLERIYTLLLDSEKEIFDQYFLEKRNIDQISKRLGKSSGSIKSIIYRMRKRLRKTLFRDLAILLLVRVSFLFMNK